MARFVEIDFLEAGQKSSGDAIALRYRDDNDVDHIHVVDGGYTDDGDKLVDHIRKHYDSATSIEHVVLTHPDGDHAAGLKKVLDEFEVGALWMNRPWNHVEALLPRFDYPYTYDGLVRRLRSNFPHTADLERIAGEQCVTINDAFQGSWIGDFLILTPSRDRYIDLIVESEKTPEAERGATTMHTVVSRVVALVRSVAAMWGQENLKGASDGTSDPPWVLWTPKKARECAGRCSWAHGSDDGSPRRSSRRRCGSVCGTTAASGRWLGSWT